MLSANRRDHNCAPFVRLFEHTDLAKSETGECETGFEMPVIPTANDLALHHKIRSCSGAVRLILAAMSSGPSLQRSSTPEE